MSPPDPYFCVLRLAVCLPLFCRSLSALQTSCKEALSLQPPWSSGGAAGSTASSASVLSPVAYPTSGRDGISSPTGPVKYKPLSFWGIEL